MKVNTTSEVINILNGTINLIKHELENNPMNQDERLNKVVALDKIGDAINLLQSVNY